LTGGVSFAAAVGQVPFNFQIGADKAKVVVRPPATPSGELEVRIDNCTGAPALVIPLTEATKSDGVTVINGVLPPLAGTHDLCLMFTQPAIEPMWGVDWVKLTPAGAN
jgi:hexosaminidase